MGARARTEMTGWKLLSLFALHVAALALFINGYLLTRIHLQEKSTQSTEALCSQPYKKLVWIVIDALRYDFVVADGRYPCLSGVSCAHQQSMPRLSALAKSDTGSVKSFRYIADAPTTTTQRLKAMVSGGLPSFFDVSNAFSASSMSDDNIIDQFVAAGKTMVFMGDSTWTDLFPHQFNISLSFPCFNVKDLDTVDDGVWQHLLPTLKAPSNWDVLIAHYLGVDHCGHTFGVDSPQMTEKLQQMDKHIGAVLDFMLSSNEFDDTLLLIAGDHGQTMGGDHGGGSPEEVDSALVAIDVGRLRSATQASAGLLDWWKKIWTKPLSSDMYPCKTNCTCGDDGNQCVNDLPQMDLVPTLSILFGVPIPFGNLGSLSPELWSIGASRCAEAQNGDVRTSSLAKATKATADQVYTYLRTYAMHPASRFPKASSQKLDALYANISYDSTQSTKFLKEANVIARHVWTQFNDVNIIAGLFVFVLTLGWHARLVWTSLQTVFSTYEYRPTAGESLFLTSMLAGVVVQSCGIFSFFYLLSEGWMVTWVVSAMVLLSTLYVAIYVGRAMYVKILFLGAFAVLCFIAAARMGLVSHSGYGFWKRLTVHEPFVQDTSPPLTNASFSWLADAIFRNDDAPMWQAACLHIVTTTIPLLFIHQLAVTNLKKTFPMLSFRRILLLMSYVFLAADLAVQTAIEKQIVPKSYSLLDIAKNIHYRGHPMDGILANFIGSAELPLYLLLPRLVLSLGSIVVLLGWFQWIFQSWKNGKASPAGQQLLLAAVSGTASGIGVIMLQISSTFSPFIALLCIAGTTCIAYILSQAKPPIAIWCWAGILSVVQTWAFFLTGHLCEFAGLQYTAGFVGFEEFSLIRSGLFVAIDTFGGMSIVILSVIGIPAIGFCFEAGKRNDNRNKGRTARDRSLSKSSGRSSSFYSKNVRFMVLFFGLSRAFAAFSATTSAAIQKRHLYAWALFAPKFAFEVFFLISTDVILLLLAYLIRF